MMILKKIKKFFDSMFEAYDKAYKEALENKNYSWICDYGRTTMY